MDGYKRAALRFLELADSDRQWLLSNLSMQERQKILAILNQLDEREEVSSNFSSSAISQSGSNGSHPQANDTLASHIVVIDAAGAKEVVQILSIEPDWLIASVLGFKHWPWTKGFCDGLSIERRAEILRAVKYVHQKIKPKAREAMIEVLADEIKKRKSKSVNGNGYVSFESILQAMEKHPAVEKPSGWRAIWIR